MADRSAIVVGGSLAGLSAAFWMRRAGLGVDVFERSAVAMRGQGAGIVLNPATIRHLDGDQAALANISVATEWLRYIDTSGGVISETPGPLRFASYDALYRSYLERFDEDCYHLAREVTGAEQDGESVVVRLASGQEQEAELLVWADGIRSTGRRHLVPDTSRNYAGYVAWRGTVPPERLSETTRAAFANAITYYVGAGTHLLAYPIRGPEGHMMVNWLWYRNVPAASLPAVLTTSAGTPGEVSVPPGRVAEPTLAELRNASSGLPPPMTELVAGTDHPFPQAVFDVAVPRLAFGRECLVGDAGFVVRPHAAAGAAKAAEDGYRLGGWLAQRGDIAAALENWEPKQLELGLALLERNRKAGERLQGSGDWAAGEPLPFGLYQQGDSEMDSAATLPDRPLVRPVPSQGTSTC
jgi:2,6-dihydroxypyridine 3-monooxygenase